ncbi:pyridoxal phosphate-dependent aminotransferase [bacterium]|nr:pyridoxal phosphate-dependent aminotransferase [candidate division CSSED10-310 bacterium]
MSRREKDFAAHHHSVQPDYLTWYKYRMNVKTDPDTVSLMSSGLATAWRDISPVVASDDALAALFDTPNPWGLPRLLDALAKRYLVKVEQVLPAQGATNALYLACRSLLEPGDHVLVESPGYEPLWMTPTACGAIVGRFHRDPAGRLDLEALTAEMRPDTRLVILTNPHNPSGVWTDRLVMKNVYRTVKRCNPTAMLLVDEIYGEAVEPRPESAVHLGDDVLAISSLTKVFGMSCLRCGWLLGPAAAVDRIRKLQVLVDGIGSNYLEALATRVINDLDRHRTGALAVMAANREIMVTSTRRLMEKELVSGMVPDFGCIYFPAIIDCPSSLTLSSYLETRWKLFTVPGEFFAMPGHLRIGLGGDSAHLEVGLERLEQGLVAFRANRG